MAEETPRQISVSRDALRADLAEMELRLRMYFDTKLGEKANAITVAELTKRVDLHESGVFPPAWELKINNQIDTRISERIKNSWALRSAKAGSLYIFVSAASLAIAIASFVASHHL